MTKHVTVHSGLFRGRSLRCPPYETTRPITGYCKKVIFDSSQCFIEGARVLDLFAGSGALGIEALSRGADYATFVDIERQATQCIQKNLNALGISDQGRVICCDALEFFTNDSYSYDFICMVPPYPIAIDVVVPLLHILDDKVSCTGCHIWVECGRDAEIVAKETVLQTFSLQKIKRRGFSSILHFVN